MHRYLIMSVGIVTLTFATAALAGDPNNWTGAYVGAHAGYGWSAWDGKQEYTDAALVPLAPFGPFDTSSHTINANGALAGGQIGYNYQIGSVVVGVEGDGSWADLKGSGSMFPYPQDPNRGTAVGTPGWNFDIKNDWLATARARAGWTTGSLLFYGTGGVAFGGLKESHTISGYPWSTTLLGTRDETKTGWTAGAGVEWVLTEHWSAKAEYLFMSFPGVGGITNWDTKQFGPSTDGFKGDFNIHTADVGINYKF